MHLLRMSRSSTSAESSETARSITPLSTSTIFAKKSTKSIGFFSLTIDTRCRGLMFRVLWLPSREPVSGSRSSRCGANRNRDHKDSSRQTGILGLVSHKSIWRRLEPSKVGSREYQLNIRCFKTEKTHDALGTSEWSFCHASEEIGWESNCQTSCYKR